MSTRKRSREGCWTCKDRRRKCDGRRPTCHNCEERDIQCEGYDLRLQWGVGIASRGRFTGAEKPVPGSVPARPVGRRRDLERKRVQNTALSQPSQLHDADSVSDMLHLNDGDGLSDSGVITSNEIQTVDHMLVEQLSEAVRDEQIFQDFLSSGIHVLHSTAVDDADLMLGPRLPALCTQSKALYSVCLAFQTTLSNEHKARFFEYFDRALSAFRTELDACATYLEDATWTAGLLLCSVGFFYGLNWTMHIQGMYAILKVHGFDDHSGQPNPFRAHLLEVMGVMDLPSFAVGRQTPCIGIWRRHCRGNLFCRYPNRDTIEHVSGLPRSLLDIFSAIGHGSEERDFWDWPGCKGTFLQCQLWEAYRLAGVLTLRNREVLPALGPVTSPTSSPYSLPPSTPVTGKISPTTEVLVARILSHVHAVVKISEGQESAQDELVINAINYPTFVAGLEVSIVNSNTEWRDFINHCFTSSHLVKSHGVENRYLLDLLEARWHCGVEAPNIDELARTYDRELGLL